MRDCLDQILITIMINKKKIAQVYVSWLWREQVIRLTERGVSVDSSAVTTSHKGAAIKRRRDIWMRSTNAKYETLCCITIISERH